MAISAAKRKTDAKWKKENKRALTCIVYKRDAADFATYCAARGISVNEALREYVARCLGRPLERRGGPGRDSAAVPGAPDLPDLPDLPENHI